jgi:hypothetical protein
MNVAASLGAIIGPMAIGSLTNNDPVNGWRNFYVCLQIAGRRQREVNKRLTSSTVDTGRLLGNYRLGYIRRVPTSQATHPSGPSLVLAKVGPLRYSRLPSPDSRANTLPDRSQSRWKPVRMDECAYALDPNHRHCHIDRLRSVRVERHQARYHEP